MGFVVVIFSRVSSLSAILEGSRTGIILLCWNLSFRSTTVRNSSSGGVRTPECYEAEPGNYG